MPIDYALPIADISDIDPLITYIPHNGVLYILMRMGLLGGSALFALVGVGLISACRLARSRDRELAVDRDGGRLRASSGIRSRARSTRASSSTGSRSSSGTLLGLMEAAHRLSRTGAMARRPLPLPRPRAPSP